MINYWHDNKLSEISCFNRTKVRRAIWNNNSPAKAGRKKTQTKTDNMNELNWFHIYECRL